MWLDKKKNNWTFPDEKSLWLIAVVLMLKFGARDTKLGDEYCYRLWVPLSSIN